MLSLKTPDKELLPLLQTGIEEIKAHPSPFEIYAVREFLKALDGDIESYFNLIEQQKQGLELDKGWVPQSLFWLFDDNTFIGFLVLRHRMTDMMHQTGVGYIGYEIIPSMRGKGYVKAGLRLLLNYARNELQLNEVIIGCREENIPSYRTMLAMVREFGGYELEKLNAQHPNKKYCVVKTGE